MKNKIIIKLFDNEDYLYPLIEILKEDFTKFKEILNKYQEEEGYTFNGFLFLLKEKGFKHKIIKFDWEVFF